MKIKLLLVSILSVMFLYMAQCNGDDTTKPEAGPLYTVGMWVPVGASPQAPDWVDMEGGITDFHGTKYMWYKGEGDSTDRTVAKKTAQGDAQAKVAESLKLIVSSQYAQAWDALGIGQNESVEKVKQGIIATKSHVTVYGFKELDSHKQQMAQLARVPKETIQNSDLGKNTIWRINVKMGIPYDEYLRLRSELMDKVKQSPTANERQKELIQKADKALKDIDKDPSEFNVSSHNEKKPI